MTNRSLLRFVSCEVDGAILSPAGVRVYCHHMTTTEDKVNALLEKVRPYVQMHGGDVHLLRIEDGTVHLKVSGACVGCGLADATYNKTIGPLLVKEIEEVRQVEFE